MRRSLSLLALVVCALALCAAPAAATTTDCRIASLMLSWSGGIIPFTPTFDMNKLTGYTATVPSSVSQVYLTAYSYVSDTSITMGYSFAAGSGALVPAGVSKASGEQSPPLTLAFGVNTVAVTEACSCQLIYKITVTRTNTYTKGDPLFAGLLGQQFQVHGVSGEVYSIITDPVMQMNSRFVFLDHGECPMLNSKKAHACWSHPGSYLGEIGIKSCSGQKLLITSGGAKHGFAKATLDGRPLEYDEPMSLHCDRLKNVTASESDELTVEEQWVASEGYVVRNSSHLITVQLSNFLLQIENSDHFVNYRVKVLDWAGVKDAHTHGLLGQTYQKPLKPGKQIKEIEGDVDMYVVKGGNLFGDEFAFNRWSEQQSNEEDSNTADK